MSDLRDCINLHTELTQKTEHQALARDYSIEDLQSFGKNPQILLDITLTEEHLKNLQVLYTKAALLETNDFNKYARTAKLAEIESSKRIQNQLIKKIFSTGTFGNLFKDIGQ